MQTSEQINEIGAALAKAQAEMQNAAFDSENPHFHSKFASLASVRDAIVPALSKNGIAMLQDLENIDGGISCTTYLIHASGQKLVLGPLIIPYTKADAWGMGSAGTYAKRYQMMAIGCVAGDADDDASGAVGKATGGAHLPKGDMGKAVHPDLAFKASVRMREVLEADVDEDVKCLHVADLHDEMNKDADLYVAAADQLKPAERSAWKQYCTMAKKKSAAEPIGRRF